MPSLPQPFDSMADDGTLYDMQQQVQYENPLPENYHQLPLGLFTDSHAYPSDHTLRLEDPATISQTGQFVGFGTFETRQIWATAVSEGHLFPELVDPTHLEQRALHGPQREVRLCPKKEPDAC